MAAAGLQVSTDKKRSLSHVAGAALLAEQAELTPPSKRAATFSPPTGVKQMAPKSLADVQKAVTSTVKSEAKPPPVETLMSRLAELQAQLQRLEGAKAATAQP
eukprot:10412363-Alexandrium_andersonii.AAC.1